MPEDHIPVPTPTNSAPSSSLAKDVSGISLSGPEKESHAAYTVWGKDSDGIFEGSRRHNEFLAFRTCLVNSWPGLYIQPILPKKMTGNKDDTFVEDRLIFLVMFMKSMAKY